MTEALGFPMPHVWDENAVEMVAGQPGMILRDWFAGQVLAPLLDKGLTTEALVEESSLVVMASYGLGGVGQAVVGSITGRVVRHIAAPVLVIR